ncbi:MAG: hypothetical protein HC803_02555 [Saprospiraceae bacterium]|nr:hypothetical protein [Saprospiraceae bacterium]
MAILMNLSSKACNCQDFDNSFIHLLESNHVFLATVMSSSECNENNKYEYELYVEANYKGTLPETKKVYTDCVTSCEFQLEKGSRVIFFTDLMNDNVNFCDLRIAFSDSSFIPIKKYLDKMRDTKLDYLELHEGRDQTGFKSKMMVQDGNVNGLVNIYDAKGNIAVKGLVKNGKWKVITKSENLQKKAKLFGLATIKTVNEMEIGCINTPQKIKKSKINSSYTFMKMARLSKNRI